jgi:hypothetical protein
MNAVFTNVVYVLLSVLMLADWYAEKHAVWVTSRCRKMKLCPKEHFHLNYQLSNGMQSIKKGIHTTKIKDFKILASGDRT